MRSGAAGQVFESNVAEGSTQNNRMSPLVIVEGDDSIRWEVQPERLGVVIPDGVRLQAGFMAQTGSGNLIRLYEYESRSSLTVTQGGAVLGHRVIPLEAPSPARGVLAGVAASAPTRDVEFVLEQLTVSLAKVFSPIERAPREGE